MTGYVNDRDKLAAALARGRASTSLRSPSFWQCCSCRTAPWITKTSKPRCLAQLHTRSADKPDLGRPSWRRLLRFQGASRGALASPPSCWPTASCQAPRASGRASWPESVGCSPLLVDLLFPRGVPNERRAGVRGGCRRSALSSWAAPRVGRPRRKGGSRSLGQRRDDSGEHSSRAVPLVCLGRAFSVSSWTKAHARRVEPPLRPSAARRKTSMFLREGWPANGLLLGRTGSSGATIVYSLSAEADALSDCPKQKGLQIQAFPELAEGFEPSTFCMASSCSLVQNVSKCLQISRFGARTRKMGFQELAAACSTGRSTSSRATPTSAPRSSRSRGGRQRAGRRDERLVAAQRPTVQTAGGNHIVVKLAPALLLRAPGRQPAGRSERVRGAKVLGLLGNTGNTDGPTCTSTSWTDRRRCSRTDFLRAPAEPGLVTDEALLQSSE